MTFEPSEDRYDKLDTTITRFRDIPDFAKEDLIAWFNSRPDAGDRLRLLALYREDRFKAWDCPHCESKGQKTRVFKADLKDDEWDHFQGTRNQDFSYFGDSDKYTEEYINAMCDSCRCHG